MSKLTPQQVLKQIAADLRRYGISYEDAAKLLGYTNKQTVANILYSKKYLAPEQAKRFHYAFGYDFDALISGNGDLFFSSPDIPFSEYLVNRDGNLRSDELVQLLEQYLNAVCVVSGNPDVLQLWENYTKNIKGRCGPVLMSGLFQNVGIIQKLILNK